MVPRLGRMKGSLSSGLLELKGLLNKQQLFFLQVQLFTSSPLIALPVRAGIAPVGVFLCVSHCTPALHQRRNHYMGCPESQGILLWSRIKQKALWKAGQAVAATQGSMLIMWQQMIVTFLNARATCKHFPRIHTAVATVWQGNMRS